MNLSYFLRNYPTTVIGAVIVVMFIVTALGAEQLAPYDPNYVTPRDSVKPPGGDYIFGADHNGRDILSRVIYGARISLLISMTSVTVGLILGVTLGALSGWNSKFETVIMRIVDMMLSFPGLITALAIVAILGSGIENVIAANMAYHIPQFARLTHGLVLSVKPNTYVMAARSVGLSDFYILLRHIMPNILGPIIVQGSLLIPDAIMTTSALSFLGLGVSPPTAEWGGMLQDGIKWFRIAPHVMLFPGGCLMLTVLGFNLLGDGLRQWLDPQLRIN
ncbi:MAG TPA: glutathione ABC transporter permease GsiD [Chloroflexi bacterium]|nr:glutathione ABC transporter permease GsiD [Chloroflexota bacterium]